MLTEIKAAKTFLIFIQLNLMYWNNQNWIYI